MIRRLWTCLFLFALNQPAWAGLVPPPQDASPALPAFLQPLAAWGFALQRAMNGQIRASLAEMKDGAALEPALALIFAAFVYGLIHAIGPGHGKLVIGSWFITRRVRLSKSLAACAIAALVQAASAIAAVAVLSTILSFAPSDVMSTTAWIEVAAYGLIAVMGIFMAIQTLRGAHSCGHDHCDHHHHHPVQIEKPAGEKGLFAMAALVGFRPCSGAILVLLFTFANHMAWLGIIAVLAMALGVGLTMSGIGLSALGLNRLLGRLEHRLSHAGLWQKVLGLLGAATVTLLGLTLLLGALAGGSPSLSG